LGTRYRESHRREEHGDDCTEHGLVHVYLPGLNRQGFCAAAVAEL
jgi:hypothetical protein